MAGRSTLHSAVKEPEVNEEEEEEDDDDDEESEDEEGSEEGESEEEGSAEESEDEEEEEEEEEDLSNRETLRKLLEPFGKEQLIDLLKDAVARNPTLWARISGSAESDPAHRRLYVHGLSWDCTSETLAAAFRPYGEIEECAAVMERSINKCKGYGFVRFMTRGGAQKALKEPNKYIGGRPTTCQLAAMGNTITADTEGRRLFVGNARGHLDAERLKAFFAQYGEIEDGPHGVDKATGKLLGYAIFIYKTTEGCKKALEDPIKVIDGSVLTCRLATVGSKKVQGPTPVMMPLSAANPLPQAAMNPLPPAGMYTLPQAAMNPAPVAMPMNPAPLAMPMNPMPQAEVKPLQPNDLSLTYASGSGFLNPSVGFLGKGFGVHSGGGVGLLNPSAGISPPVSMGVAGSSYGVGIGSAYGVGMGPGSSYGVGMGPRRSYGVGMGVNTVSPSVIGSYQSLAALQGLGASQSSQMTNSDMNPGMRSQSSLGSSAYGLPSYPW